MFLGTFWCVHEHFSVRFSYGVGESERGKWKKKENTVKWSNE